MYRESDWRMLTTPEPRRLVIHQVGALRTTPRGNRYLECDTPSGRVAVWGSMRNMRNIELLRGQPLPCEVVLMSVPSSWEQHDWWVPEDTTVFLPAGSHVPRSA